MKSNDRINANQAKGAKILGNRRIDLDKRNLVKWIPPVVMSLALPAHATTSMPCPSTLVANAPVPSKCSGPANALVGQASITIVSDSEPIEIASISHNAPGTDTITFPVLPAAVSSSSGIDVGWQGPGSDALTCLPINTITLTVTYNCGPGTQNATASVNVTSVLAAALP